MNDYKYKVHSAIYSCNNGSSAVKATYDVTNTVQSMLSTSNNDGILTIDGSILNEVDVAKPKCFAIVVTVVYPDGRIITRFCSAIQGSTIDIKASGVVCSF